MTEKLQTNMDYTKNKCSKCGSTKFKVEVTEIYNITGDFAKGEGEFEDEYTRDLEYESPVRCGECGQPVDEVEGNEIYDLVAGNTDWK